MGGTNSGFKLDSGFIVQHRGYSHYFLITVNEKQPIQIKILINE